jgi:hypothetical protein
LGQVAGLSPPPTMESFCCHFHHQLEASKGWSRGYSGRSVHAPAYLPLCRPKSLCRLPPGSREVQVPLSRQCVLHYPLFSYNLLTCCEQPCIKPSLNFPSLWDHLPGGMLKTHFSSTWVPTFLPLPCPCPLPLHTCDDPLDLHLFSGYMLNFHLYFHKPSLYWEV